MSDAVLALRLLLVTLFEKRIDKSQWCLGVPVGGADAINCKHTLIFRVLQVAHPVRVLGCHLRDGAFPRFGFSGI